jgi:hypothetical protein
MRVGVGGAVEAEAYCTFYAIGGFVCFIFTIKI